MTTIEVNDIQVSFNEAGDSQSSAQPVVFIHGLAEGKESWDRTQRDLTDRHTFAYDLRGHGATTNGENAGTLQQLGEDLIGFLEAVTGPATVVGFSLGGTIALWGAAERPDLVQNTIVLGTSSIVGRSAVSFYEQRIEMAQNTASEAFRDAIRSDTAAALHRAQDRLEEITLSRLNAIGDGRGYINASQAMAAVREQPLTPKLAAIDTHVDVIGAEHDAFCPQKASQIIVDALDDATYHEIPDAGHLMNVDNPAEVTRLLRTVL